MLNAWLQMDRVDHAKTRDALRDTLQEMDAISDEITRLQQQLNGLQSKAALYRFSLSPWRMLPDDMWIEIFERCLPPDGCAAMSIKVAPLLLTLVCKHWRQIALSTNSLWAKVHFVMPVSIAKGTSSAAQYNRRVQALSSWLLRSGSLPITITLAKWIPPPSPTSQWAYDAYGRRAFRGLFRLLTAHASRLRSVNFPPHCDDIAPTIAKGASFSEPITFPLLENISSPSESILTQWPLALKAPNVRSMSLMLRNIHTADVGILQSGPWTNLTQLNIYDWCSSWTLLGLLLHCPSLLSLSVLCGSETEQDPTLGGPFTSIPHLSQLYIASGKQQVILPHLHTLKVDGMGVHALTRGLQVPALKHASCNEMQQPLHDDDELGAEFSLSAIPSSINSYGRIMLQSLALRMSNPHVRLVESLISFLQTQDDLRILELEMDMWNGTEQMIHAVQKLLQELTIKESCLARLPSLEEFELSGIYDGTVDSTLAFLHSRLVNPPEHVHQLCCAKIRLHRISVEMARRAGQHNNVVVDEMDVRATHVTRECLVKMKEFLKLPEIASSSSEISFVVSGSNRPPFMVVGDSSVSIDPFHGLDDRLQLDRFQPLRPMGADGPEVQLEEFFHEDIMTLWARESEGSSSSSSEEDETSDHSDMEN